MPKRSENAQQHEHTQRVPERDSPPRRPTITQLRREAADKGIKGRSSMNKAELEAALKR